MGTGDEYSHAFINIFLLGFRKHDDEALTCQERGNEEWVPHLQETKRA
jgi:hypothetical protein